MWGFCLYAERLCGGFFLSGKVMRGFCFMWKGYAGILVVCGKVSKDFFMRKGYAGILFLCGKV